MLSSGGHELGAFLLGRLGWLRGPHGGQFGVRVPAHVFGVRGDGLVTPLLGVLLPRGPGFHSLGELCFGAAVESLTGSRRGGVGVMERRRVLVAAFPCGLRSRVGEYGVAAHVVGAEADLPELVADEPRRPRGFSLVAGAQVEQSAIGFFAEVYAVDRAEGGERGMPGWRGPRGS